MAQDRDVVLVQHILDAVKAIEGFVGQMDVVTFVESDLVSSAVVKKIEIIGEASNRLSDEFRQEHSDIPWSQIVGTRNILIHDYIGIDLEAVWNMVKADLPKLKASLQQ